MMLKLAPGTVFLLMASICSWKSVEGFSEGPPAAACDTLSPNPAAHGAPPQLTPLSFQLIDLTQLGENANGSSFYIPGQTYQSMFLTTAWSSRSVLYIKFDKL